MSDPDRLPPPHAARVFDAGDVTVVTGANLGDGLDAWEEAAEGDVYRLNVEAAPLALLLMHGAGPAGAGAAPAMAVAPGSPVGAPGDVVALCLRLSLMSTDGDAVELLGLEHRPARETAAAARRRYLLPLSPMARGRTYTLLRIDTDPGPVRLADIICVSLGRGTRITLPDGRQQTVETLTPGDRILTRDHGPQTLRWLGRATLRAQGAFAPVVITAGVLGNAAELVVSQHHRVFLYQRRRHAAATTSELLVQARHLVDGSRVFLREGGFVDYFSLVFDRHEIVYAEGIPTESLLVNEATLAHLPETLAEEVRARFPGLSQRQHFGTEAGRHLLDRIGRDVLLGREAGG